MRTRKSFLDSQKKLNFPNSKIEFMSINVEEDIIDVFLLVNNKKVISKNPGVKNYYRIIAKDIGVKNISQELNFIIVNNIKLTINIKFKNKFSTQSMSVKDRLKFFNHKNETKIEKLQNDPKKLKMPVSFRETKKEPPKKAQENNINKQKKEVKKDDEEIQQSEESKKNEEVPKNKGIKKIEENNLKEPKEQKKEVKKDEEVQKNEKAKKIEEVANKEEIKSDENVKKGENNKKANEEFQNSEKKYCVLKTSEAFMKNINGFGTKEHCILIKNILENIHLLFDYYYEKEKLFFHYDDIKIEGDEVILKSKVKIEEFNDEPKYNELNFIFNFKKRKFTELIIKTYKNKEKNGYINEKLESLLKCQCNLQLQEIFYKYVKILYKLRNIYSFYDIERDYFNRKKEVENELKALKIHNNELIILAVDEYDFTLNVYNKFNSKYFYLRVPVLNPDEYDSTDVSLDFLNFFDFGQHILTDEKLCYDRLTIYNLYKLLIAVAKKISSIFDQFAFFRINEIKYLENCYYGNYNTEECSTYISIFLYLFKKEYYMSFEFNGRIFHLIHFCEVEDAQKLNFIRSSEFND